MKDYKVLLLLFFSFLLSSPAFGQVRRALIIDNRGYGNLDGKKPLELRNSLIQQGYEVDLLVDETRDKIITFISEFPENGSSVSLLYWFGQTYTNKFENRTYLLIDPVNAKRDLSRNNLLSFDEVGYFLFRSTSQENIIIFDLLSEGFLRTKEKQTKFHESTSLELSRHYGNAGTIAIVNVEYGSNPEKNSYFSSLFTRELYNGDLTIKESLQNIYTISSRNELSSTRLLFYDDFNSTLSLGQKKGTAGYIKNIMPSFPFPPPKASANHVINRDFFTGIYDLFELGRILSGILNTCGYHEMSFYQVPEGFALVTRIEKIESDATPSPLPERWNVPYQSYDDFSLKNYFKSLFFAENGKYRIIVFVITSIPFSQTEETMEFKTAKRYLKSGYNTLPIEFKEIDFLEDYECTALIYEFDTVEYEESMQVEFSEHLGVEHLNKNNFIPILKKRLK